MTFFILKNVGFDSSIDNIKKILERDQFELWSYDFSNTGIELICYGDVSNMNLSRLKNCTGTDFFHFKQIEHPIPKLVIESDVHSFVMQSKTGISYLGIEYICGTIKRFCMNLNPIKKRIYALVTKIEKNILHFVLDIKSYDTTRFKTAHSLSGFGSKQSTIHYHEPVDMFLFESCNYKRKIYRVDTTNIVVMIDH